MTNHRLHLVFVACLVALAALSSPVLAQSEQRDSSIVDALERVPPDADLCVVLEDGAELLQTNSGRFVVDTLELLGATDDGGAWASIIDDFGLDPATAFEELMGRSVVIVMRREATGDLAWALRSNVSLQTVGTLRTGLAAAPRDVNQGRAVYAVEDGRYAMTIERVPGERRAMITLAPADADQLFQDMLRRDRPDAETLFGRGVFPVGRNTSANVKALVYANIDELLDTDPQSDEPVEEDRAPTWIGLAASVNESSIGMSALVSAHELAGPAGIPFRTWPVRWFEELNRDAAIVMLDRTNNELLSLLLGDEQGNPGVLPWRLPSEVRALAAHRAAFIVTPGKDGRLEGAVAMETDDIRTLADALDSAMPALIGEERRTYKGLPAAAVRTAEVPAFSPMVGDGENARLSWNYRVAGDCSVDQETGWWTVGVGSSAVSDLGRILALDTAPWDRPDEPALDFIGMGIIRPAPLVAAADLYGVDLGAAGALLARINELEWHEVRVGSDTGIAAITLRLNEEVRMLADEPKHGQPERLRPVATERDAR